MALNEDRAPKTEIEMIGEKAELWTVHETDGKETWFCYEDKPGIWICVLTNINAQLLSPNTLDTLSDAQKTRRQDFCSSRAPSQYFSGTKCTVLILVEGEKEVEGSTSLML
jgi:hypothetical protein